LEESEKVGDELSKGIEDGHFVSRGILLVGVDQEITKLNGIPLRQDPEAAGQDRAVQRTPLTCQKQSSIACFVMIMSLTSLFCV
jgi:hypothetical protein